MARINMLRPAVFLDRDGTLNVERNYLHRKEDWQWIDGVPEALARLAASGYALVVVTNQSGIARGMYSADDVGVLHGWVNDDLCARVGVRLDAVYVCPHHPDFGGPCTCRKPAPGMLKRAAEDLGLNLAASWMIGDKASDVSAGIAAGCRTVLVMTGYGGVMDEGVRESADAVVADLSAAVDVILG